MTRQDMFELLSECDAMAQYILKDLNIKYNEGTDVYIRPFKDKWGQCDIKTYCGYCLYSRIFISEDLLATNNETLVVSILLHEYIHTVNNGLEHGIEFEEIANRIVKAYEVCKELLVTD